MDGSGLRSGDPPLPSDAASCRSVPGQRVYFGRLLSQCAAHCVGREQPDTACLDEWNPTRLGLAAQPRLRDPEVGCKFVESKELRRIHAGSLAAACVK